ncbi:hypothetical protein HA402_000951 [Bradysia odoriphaga]|nr:hypothetical protein HA402_000951 [Bradysia odoriphaga]
MNSRQRFHYYAIDEIDLTDSAEYKRAQENLLSASEQVKVKDVQIAPGDGISSDDKILPNTNFPAASIQDIKEVETAENILPKNDSTSSNSSTTNPVSSMTEISMEIKGTVSKSAEDVAVKYDGVIESGSLSGDIPVASENTTADPTAETKPEAYNLSKSGTSAEKTGPKLNTTHANADMEYSTPMGDTKNRALLEDLIKNKLNALVTDPVKRGEVEAQEKLTENAFNAVVKSNETGGDSFPNSIDSKSNPKTVSIPGELHHNVTEEDDSVRLDTTQKLDFEAEQLETEDVKKDKDISVIPNSPTTSPNAGTSKENHHKNHNDSETHEDNNFVNQYESHIYDLDDWDDDFTDTSSFDDFTENPCDCSRTETPNNYDSFVENDPTVSIEYPPIEPCVEHFHPPDYSTNYGDADVDHSQHTDDNTSDFPDDFDSEDLDDLLNSDVEFITNGDNNCDHFDEDTDDFAF